MKQYQETKIEGYELKHATIDDAQTIVDLVKALATYEDMLDLVHITKKDIIKHIFENKMAEVVIGEYNKEAVGYILFFQTFSTFVGKPGIYLEDLFVKPEFRKMGFGKCFFEYLGCLATERDCGRLEWTCLDWNEPSIRFYEARGGQMRKEWNLFRLDGENLRKLGEDFI